MPTKGAKSVAKSIKVPIVSPIILTLAVTALVEMSPTTTVEVSAQVEQAGCGWRITGAAGCPSVIHDTIEEAIADEAWQLLIRNPKQHEVAQ